MPLSRYAPPAEVPGLTARRIAADILDGVLHKRRTLDEQLDGPAAHHGLKALADRDRALMRRLVATILRRLGTLGHVLSRLLDRGVPTDAPRAQSALLIGAAQILWMDVPDHAAVDLSVRLVQADRRAAKYAGLVNAVLRRCAREGQSLLDEVKDQALDVPPWLLARWSAHYGETAAKDIAVAIGHEPPLDLTVKSDPAHWATRLHGEVLPTGTVRTPLHGSVTMLPGFNEGQWWVQDAAAALPVRLFGDLTGRSVVDLCAAPGGKTAQLVQAGAQVTALDR
ncbi:MAG: MFS transporter, partial [Rhizobiales bacterium]|nr:MFS transporter [Hyphomicrobiales bacterium]